MYSTVPWLLIHSCRLQNLFQVANEQDNEVKKNVCRAFVMLLEVKAFELLPHMQNIITVSI